MKLAPLDFALVRACLMSSVEGARAALDAGANPNAMNASMATPALIAAHRSVELLTLLVDRGADIDQAGSQGRTPAIAAAAGGQLECLLLLIDRGADLARLDESGSSALDVAILEGHPDCALIARAHMARMERQALAETCGALGPAKPALRI